MSETSLRVIVLIDRYLPILGGAQNNVHELSRRLLARRFSIGVLTRRIFTDLKEEEVYEDIKVRRFGYSPNRILSKAVCCILIVLWLVKNRDEYDVVFCVPCAYVTDLLPAYFASLITKKPYIIRTTLYSNFDFMLSWRARSVGDLVKKVLCPPVLWRRVVKGAGAVGTQSRAVLEEAIKYQVSGCEVIPNGVDTARFRPANARERRTLRLRLGLPENKIIATYTGRYSIPKNLVTLIRAAELIHRKEGQYRLYVLIVGATEAGGVTSTEKDVKEYVAQKNLGDLVGFMDDVENVQDYLRASDIFVLPSYLEGMSNAVIEAMCCGLPTICGNIREVRAMFADGEGLFFSPMDVEALSAHIRNLMKSQELRESYGSSLAFYARDRYSIQKVAQQYRDLFFRVVNRPEMLDVTLA